MVSDQSIKKNPLHMEKKILITVLLFLLTFPLFAQNGLVVNGRVTSGSDGMEMIGVNIIIKGTSVGTTTDVNGRFSILVDSEKDVLVFTMVGFTRKEVTVGKNVNMEVVLDENQELLDEVLVVGYGVQKKASAVGSITQAKGEDLIKAGGAANISTALTGMLPGVTSLTNTGEPGKDQAKIYIRGRSTWGNTDPLILVDGIERTMNNVDPNEVESISVLKDASATAVFGVKGANGVILITTKRGAEGKAQISFSSNIGIKQPTFSFNVLDQVAARQLYNEANRNEGAWDVLYSENNINYWRTHSDPYYHPEINWREEVFKNFTVNEQYNLNISGGNKKVKYFSSLGYMKDGDIFKTERQPEYNPEFSYKRYNYRSNIDIELSSSSKLSVNLSGDLGVRNRPMSYMGRDPFTSATEADFYQVLYLTPNYLFPVRYENGVLGTSPIGRWWNPVYNLSYQGSANEKTSNIFSDIIFNQKLDLITKGLSFQAKVSYNTAYQTRQLIEKDILAMYQLGPDTQPQWMSTIQPPDEWVEKPAIIGNNVLSSYMRDLYYEGALNYANTWGKHDFTGLALFNRRQLNSGNSFPRYEEAWVGRLTYSYNYKYLAEINAAYTGSEKFGPGKRFGFFPSYALGWFVSEEKFYKEIPWIDFMNKLKVRYSYGEVGSDRSAAPFTYVTDYSSGRYIVLGSNVANLYGPLYFENKAANVNATWETSVKQNIGFELGFFTKLNVNLDFYKERRKGILMNRSNTTPAWFGQIPADANIGETKSKGYELEMEWRDRINKDFNYFVRGGFSFQDNRVLNRDDAPNTPEYQKRAGKPISFDNRLLHQGFLNSWDDVYNYSASEWQNDNRQPGDALYVDYNADGKISDMDAVPMKLNSIPLYTYSMNFGFSYKGFDLRANFYGVFDVEKRLTYNLLSEFPTDFVMAWPESLNRWTPETTETATRPRIGRKIKTHNFRNSSYGVFDASYLRLKSVEISYNINKKLLQHIRLEGCQIYMNGYNLFTFTNFDKRIDPETASESVYPLTKRYNIGLRLKM